MKTRVTKKERARIYNDVATGFKPPKSETWKLLFRVGELAAAFFLEPHGTNTFSLSKIVDINRGKEARKEYQYRMKALYRLKTLKLIQTEKRGDDLFISLTKKGWTSYLSKIRYRGAKRLPKNEWCFVSFDIPEDIRDIRRVVRRELKKADFKLIHHSLWATRFDVAEAFAAAIRQANAESWVSIYVGRQIT